MTLYFQKYDLNILRLTQAGVLIYTANFNQFTWEMNEKKLDIRYFYLGRYLSLSIFLKLNNSFFFKHLLYWALEMV